jgi:hypothetical protein
MRIIPIGGIVFTPDDGISATTITPPYTAISPDYDSFRLFATFVYELHLAFRGSGSSRGGECIIGSLEDQSRGRSIVATTRISPTTHDRHTAEYISASTRKARGEPGTERVCDDMNIASRDTVTLGHITDDRIDEVDIFCTRPTIGTSIRQSRWISYDRITLSFESHISSDHNITIGPTMDCDDEFCWIRCSIAPWNREDIAPSLPGNRDFVCPARENLWCYTSLREIRERSFFVVIFSYSEYEFTRFASCHRRGDRVTRCLEDSIGICKFLI